MPHTNAFSIAQDLGRSPLPSMLQNQLIIKDIEKGTKYTSKLAMKAYLTSYNDQLDFEDKWKSYNIQQEEE